MCLSRLWKDREVDVTSLGKSWRREMQWLIKHCLDLAAEGCEHRNAGVYLERCV